MSDAKTDCAEIPTPRTKKAILAAQHLHCRGSFPVVYADRMAELECELTIANDKIARLMNCADGYYEAIKRICGVYEQKDYYNYNVQKEVDMVAKTLDGQKISI